MIVNKNNDYIDLCGFNIYSKSKKECLDEIFSREKVHVVSGNPEVLYTALLDDSLKHALTLDNSLIIPDGVGVKIGAKLNKKHISEKIAGVELMVDICERCAALGKSVYLLGASDESLNSCVSSLKNRFPLLNIVGFNNGYFDYNNPDELIQDISALSPDVLFVAMGCPKQERFILKYMDTLPCSIFMGVGGSFDVIGGTKKRAPKWMVSLGLEWLYRVIKEPFRIKRLTVIPKFLIRSLKTKQY